MRDENKVEIPKDLALAILDWHGGQGSSVYAVGSSGYAGNAVDPELVSEAIDELETDGAPGSLVEAMREILYAFEEQREPDPDVIAAGIEDEDDPDDDDFDDEDFDDEDYEEDEDEDSIQMNPPGDGSSISSSEMAADEAAMARDRRRKLGR